LHRLTNVPPKSANENKVQKDKNVSFLFKTREGGLGIIQIAGFTDNPKGVKIRYKMVQKESAGKTNVQVGGLKGAI